MAVFFLTNSGFLKAQLASDLKTKSLNSVIKAEGGRQAGGSVGRCGSQEKFGSKLTKAAVTHSLTSLSPER